MHKFHFIPITALIVLCVLGLPASVLGKSISAPYEIKIYKVTQKSYSAAATINLNGKVRVSTLVGEPLVACNAAWSFWKGVGGEPVISINNKQISGIPREVLDKVTLHSVKLGFETVLMDGRMFAKNTHYELSCDPGAMEKPDSGKVSFTVPGSPSWGETFHVRDTFDGFNKKAATFADKKTAKQIMIQVLARGFATTSGSAKVLSAEINLGAVVDWLEKKDKLATQKLKDEKKKASKDKDNFWSGGKKDKDKAKTKTAETKKKSDGDGFWSGKKPSQKAAAQKTAKVGSGNFWAGNTTIERKKRQAKIQKLQALKRKKLAAKKAADAAKVLIEFKDKKSRLYGYKNKKGEIVIPPQYKITHKFYDGVATVKASNNSWGVIDKTGSWVIKPQFASLGTNFSEGMVPAQQTRNGQYGYINKKGKWVISPRYYYANNFSHKRAIVRIKQGPRYYRFIIDPSGRQIYRAKGDISFSGNGFSETRFIKKTGTCGGIKNHYRVVDLNLDGKPLGSSKNVVRSAPELCLRRRK